MAGWATKRLLLPVHFSFPIFLVLKIPYIALGFMCIVLFSSCDVLSEAG